MGSRQYSIYFALSADGNYLSQLSNHEFNVLQSYLRLTLDMFDAYVEFTINRDDNRIRFKQPISRSSLKYDILKALNNFGREEPLAPMVFTIYYKFKDTHLEFFDEPISILDIDAKTFETQQLEIQNNSYSQQPRSYSQEAKLHPQELISYSEEPRSYSQRPTNDQYYRVYEIVNSKTGERRTTIDKNNLVPGEYVNRDSLFFTGP